MSKLGKKLIAAANEGISSAIAQRMSWSTKELSPGNVLIEADISDMGVIVVGSIVSKNNRWFVEIMWTGPGGDYRADFADYIQALAYVQGVSDAHDRLP